MGAETSRDDSDDDDDKYRKVRSGLQQSSHHDDTIPYDYSEMKNMEMKKGKPYTLDKKLRRAGLRSGKGRGEMEQKALFEKIPPQVRTNENWVRNYLADKDASHIKPHQQGGSGNVDNLVWENRSINRARGAQPMDDAALASAGRADEAADLAALQTNLGDALAAGAMTGGLLSVLDEELNLVRDLRRCKNVSGPEAFERVASASAKGALGGAAGAALWAGAGAAAPATTAAVASIAAPIATPLAAVGLFSRLDRAFSSESTSWSPGLFCSHHTTTEEGWFGTRTVIKKRGWFTTETEVQNTGFWRIFG